jgi:hypothetical protein
MLRRLFKVIVRERARCSALLLLVCLFLPLVQAALASAHDPEASLPACCRSHGRHKCSMRVPLSFSTASDSEPTARTAQVSEKCPWAPNGTSSTNLTHFGFLDPRRIPSSFGLSTLLHAPRTPLRGESRLRANHKRGPPSFSIFA